MRTRQWQIRKKNKIIESYHLRPLHHRRHPSTQQTDERSKKSDKPSKSSKQIWRGKEEKEGKDAKFELLHALPYLSTRAAARPHHSTTLPPGGGGGIAGKVLMSKHWAAAKALSICSKASKHSIWYLAWDFNCRFSLAISGLSCDECLSSTERSNPNVVQSS